MSFEIIKPFGPSIAKVIIPPDIIDQINSYIDNLVKDEKKSKNLDYGSELVGNVSQEFILTEEFMRKIKWGEFLGESCQKWILEENNTILKKFDVLSSWVVRQFKNEYNPVHYHNGHISGVGYLKVPSDMGETIQKNKKKNHNGKLVLIDGSKKLMCNPTYIITPKKGEFFLFPSYMMHTVYPFTNTEEERRSVSFNASIDNESAKLAK